MKRSLMALATVAAMSSTAVAQTNVQLTGSLDMAVESVNADANGGISDLKVTNGIWAGSRVAIVGTEDLGGGLRGLFNIEHRLSPDTGTVTSGATFWAGQAWVGLQGGFGTIRLGRQYTPLRRALEPGDVTGHSWYNNGDGLGGITTRFNNDLSYQSPSLGGLVIHAAYAAGESTATPADNKLGDAIAVSGVGSFGPAQIGLGYQRIDAGRTANVDDTTEIGISVRAAFGRFGIGVAATQREANDVKRRAYFGSLSLGLGAGTAYLTLKQDDQGTDLDNTGFGLTYAHGLSKRTFLYASLGYNTVEQATGSDTKPRSIALGLRHIF
ncbi:MAG: porin [Lautropia sp.]